MPVSSTSPGGAETPARSRAPSSPVYMWLTATALSPAAAGPRIILPSRGLRPDPLVSLAARSVTRIRQVEADDLHHHVVRIGHDGEAQAAGQVKHAAVSGQHEAFHLLQAPDAGRLDQLAQQP